MNISHLVYKEAYEKYQTLNWLTPNIFGSVKLHWHIQNKFAPLYNIKFNELYLQKYPTRTPLSVEKINSILLDENHKDTHIKVETYIFINELINIYLTEQIEVYTDCEYILFNSILPTVELTDDFNLYETSSSSTYLSQGYGADKYAKQALFIYELVCEANNIPFEVREIRKNLETYNSYSVNHITTYEFWCKCEKYQLWHLVINDNKDTLQIAKLCWKHGVNPKVLFPTMPEDIYYQSLDEWNK